MQLRWVGDPRDYAKWHCVLNEAGADDFVFYVPMLADDDWKLPDSHLPIRPDVVEFFDSLKSLAQFERLLPGRIDIHERKYTHSTSADYFREVCSRIDELAKNGNKLVVFVDPDTGIEPPSGAGATHVRIAHIKEIWKRLESGDRLIVYQHAPRDKRDKEWLERIRERLESQVEFRGCVTIRPPIKVGKDAGFVVMKKPMARLSESP